MNPFQMLVSKCGRERKTFINEYFMICKLFGMPEVKGWAKDGVWVYIPAESADEGLHSILYAQTDGELTEQVKADNVEVKSGGEK